jgi:hypothetical protein
MTGKSYYITTLGEWQRHAARFANSHFIALDSRAGGEQSPDENGFVGAWHAMPGNLPWRDVANPATPTAAMPARPELGDVQRVSTGNAAGHNPANTESSLTETNSEMASDCQACSPGMACHAPTGENTPPLHADTKILVLIEADEGVHLALESEPTFEALPHPLAQKPISDAAQSALAPHGVAPGATTFDAAEAVARVHPLLRHRVF